MINDMRSCMRIMMICLAVAFFSCSDEKENATPEFQPNKESFSFGKTGGETFLYVKTNVPLTVVSDKSWCEVNPENSTSTNTLKYKIIVSANEDTDGRTASVGISAAGVTKTVSVNQLAGEYLLAKTTSFSLTGDAQHIELELSHSGSFDVNVTNGSSWISRVERPSSRAITDTSVYFRIEKNQMENTRKGMVLISMGELYQELEIEQAGTSVPEADKTGMESDAVALAQQMHMGWNLGNTLEAPGSELAWGNPLTTREMISVVKNSGFNAVRIPCAWDSHLEDATTFRIKESWLARVREVVDYCVENEMYAILNIHWDGGWLENNCTPDKQDAVNEKQRILWTQIASYFRDYDERLLFAGCNEPNVDNAVQMAVLKSYEQTFIDAVRATGGRNAWRNLIIQGPGTDIDKTYSIMEMPADIVPDRLMMEVHYYSPWLFCILEEDGNDAWSTMHYFWGAPYEKYATGEYAGRWSGEWGEEYLLSQFAKMQKQFASQRIPVILGEFGAVRRVLADPVIQQAHDESRAYFFRYVMEQSKNHGLIPFFWDNGGNNMPLFDRKNDMTPNMLQLQAMQEGAAAGEYPF